VPPQRKIGAMWSSEGSTARKNDICHRLKPVVTESAPDATRPLLVENRRAHRRSIVFGKNPGVANGVCRYQASGRWQQAGQRVGQDGPSGIGVRMADHDWPIIALVGRPHGRAAARLRGALRARTVFGTLFCAPATPDNRSFRRLTLNAAMRVELDRIIEACAAANKTRARASSDAAHSTPRARFKLARSCRRKTLPAARARPRMSAIAASAGVPR
jgi:hypothetical protein